MTEPNWDYLDREIKLGSEWRHCTKPDVYIVTGFSILLDGDENLDLTELVMYQLKNKPESRTYSRSREQFLGLKMLIDGKTVHRFEQC